MSSFKLKIESEAYSDIQEGISYYNSKKKGLGREFHLEVKEYLKKLTSFYFFQIRYDENRCLPLKRFPFMIHYTVDEENQWIVIRAVLNTHRDPGIWKSRR